MAHSALDQKRKQSNPFTWVKGLSAKMALLDLLGKLMLIAVESHTPGSGVTAVVFSSLRILSFGVSLYGWVDKGQLGRG